MGNMKELSGYGRENEKFKSCLIVKCELENTDMAVNSSSMIDFFQAFLGSLTLNLQTFYWFIFGVSDFSFKNNS